MASLSSSFSSAPNYRASVDEEDGYSQWLFADSEIIGELQHLDRAASAEAKFVAKNPTMTLTLDSMFYALTHGSVEAGLLKESKDLVFYLANDNLGKPIMIFLGTMSTLLREAFPRSVHRL